MTAAATPLPSEAKRALRPNRSPIANGPTRPRLIAAIAGPSTQLAAACNVAAATTTGKIGHAAYPSALKPIVATASPATSRSERAASTMAPPGICPISADETADRQHKADLDLGPLLRRQIDRDERTETGLHVREKKDEPVEATQALPRRRWRRRRPARRRFRRPHWIAVTADRPWVNPVDQFSGRAREQAASPKCQGLNGCRLPDAPSTTIGVSSLYSGAAFT